jgi:hypothetical protein
MTHPTDWTAIAILITIGLNLLYAGYNFGMLKATVNNLTDRLDRIEQKIDSYNHAIVK